MILKFRKWRSLYNYFPKEFLLVLGISFLLMAISRIYFAYKLAPYKSYGLLDPVKDMPNLGVEVVVLILCYALVKIWKVAFLYMKSEDWKIHVCELKRLLFWGLSYFVVIEIVQIAIAHVLGVLYLSADVHEVILWGERYNDLEKYLFGKPVYCYLNNLLNTSLWSEVFVRAYTFILLAAKITLFACLFKKGKLFAQFMLGFFLTIWFCIPIWIFFPSVSPAELYKYNIFSLSENRDVQLAQNQILQPKSERFISWVENSIWIDQRKEFLAISTNPSLHVGWSVVIIYFAYAVNKRLLYLFGPWAVFNFLATMYLWQHFFIDTIFGIICGLLAVFVARKAKLRYYESTIEELILSIKRDIMGFKNF